MENNDREYNKNLEQFSSEDGIGNSSQDSNKDIKKRPNNSKTVILWLVIALSSILLTAGVAWGVGKGLGMFKGGVNTEQQEQEGNKKITDVSSVSFDMPKRKSKPKPVEVKKEEKNLFKEKEEVEVVEKNTTKKKKQYVVLKASTGSMIKSSYNKQTLEKQEKAEAERLKKQKEEKERIEQEQQEKALYPYGYYYKWVNGQQVKVPRTTNAPTSTYVGKESTLGKSIFQAKTEASRFDYDRNFILERGSVIPCSLDTRIITGLAGGVMCTITDDVYSMNGTVLLIEKGSKVFGFFEEGQIKIGMDRIFVIWQEIRTPEGIVIPVDSGSSSELGDTGTAGYIDYHWALRFTSALLVSIFDDAFSAAVDNQAKGNYTTESTQETVDNMATEVLKRFIDIEPTLYKNHGTRAAIFTNKDIDFSSIYKLELNNGSKK